MAKKYIPAEEFIEKLDIMITSAANANLREALKEWGKTIAVDAIPVELLKAEKTGCNMAICTDMGGSYDIRRRNAIENILDWYDSPDYREREARSGANIQRQAIKPM